MRDYRHFLFYSTRIELERLYLDEAETHHAAAVLRLSKGDPFIVTDGCGMVYECIYESLAGRELAGAIARRETIPRRQSILHAIVGLPERDAFESLLAGLTVLGVARITPLVCAYCQQAWWERNSEKLSRRSQSKMIAAMKQSLYPYLPRLDPAVPFAAIRSLMNGVCIVADPRGVSFLEVVDAARKEPSPLTVVVGPPGGFAPEEAASLGKLGAMSVRIAPTRLTTELAAITLCGAILAATLTDAPR